MLDVDRESVSTLLLLLEEVEREIGRPVYGLEVLEAAREDPLLVEVLQTVAKVFPGSSWDRPWQVLSALRDGFYDAFDGDMVKARRVEGLRWTIERRPRK